MAVTAATVSKWSKLNNGLPLTGDDLTLLELVITAVTAHIGDHYYLSDPMTESQELAIILQASRLWRRRDTPEGIIAFDEVGAIRVSRIDGDVQTLLTKKVVFA